MLAAAFLSTILPGAGHLLINRRRAGIKMLILFCALLSICWPLRLPIYFAAIAGLVFGMLALCITAVVHCAYGRGHGNERPSQWWLALLLPLAFGMTVVHVNWATRSTGFQVFQVPSRSMENTVPMDAHIMVDRWYYRGHSPARGDIIVYLNKEGFYIMKRVIARGGETIRSSNGTVFVDDIPISEPYVIHSGSAPFELNKLRPIQNSSRTNVRDGGQS